MADDVAWMQIYGQSYWHQPAKICGDKTALAELRDAAAKALEEGEAKIVVFASDGEGYELSVCLSDQREMDQMPIHYTQEVGRTEWDSGYDYAKGQLMPMIRSLQERLRKLEGTPLKKDKLMEAAEK